MSRTVLAAMEALPAAALAPVSRTLGLVLDAVLAGRRRVVGENVELAFGPSPTRPVARHLSQASFANLCRSFLELSKIPRTRRMLLKQLTFRNPAGFEAVRALAAEGPLIFSASHFGAYEISGIAAGALGIPITTLARPLDNPWLEAYLNGIRMRFGQVMASNRGGAQMLIRALRSGRSVAVLVDLNKRGRSVFVDYFGRPAATATTAAQLACIVRRPLVPVFTYRTARPMHFEIEVGDPIWPRREADRRTEIRRLLQEATAEVERRVRAQPDQWLWTHRRWKTRPADEAPATAST